MGAGLDSVRVVTEEWVVTKSHPLCVTLVRQEESLQQVTYCASQSDTRGPSSLRPSDISMCPQTRHFTGVHWLSFVCLWF